MLQSETHDSEPSRDKTSKTATSRQTSCCQPKQRSDVVDFFPFMANELKPVSAFAAFESQLKTLCLQEFPCGVGSWVSLLEWNEFEFRMAHVLVCLQQSGFSFQNEHHGKTWKQLKNDATSAKYPVTLKGMGSNKPLSKAGANLSQGNPMLKLTVKSRSKHK